MKLVSTRDFSQKADLSYALLNPSARGGGLFSPERLPLLSEDFFKQCEDLSYKQIALKIIESFGFDVSSEIFESALRRYDKFENSACPVQIKKLSENAYILELYHGPTLAFKDMALQPFGALLKSIAKARNEKFLIMCATSGDTGPATLEAFADDENIKAVCLYPQGGTSEIQRQQMVKQSAANLKILGVRGNFDDTQRALKSLLADEDFKNELARANLNLSAANSVNFGRILFQIIYYLYASIYFSKHGVLSPEQNLKQSDQCQACGKNFGGAAGANSAQSAKFNTFDVIVPSGNFGNALGAYFAKKMGAKIGKIKIASNANNILTELFTRGIYDLRNRELIRTISPAMDILISSNVERLLSDMFGDARTSELMQSLARDKFYKLDASELAKLREVFEADFCDDTQCAKFIKQESSRGVLIDPHTATCFKLLDESRLNLVISTAKWIKFTPSMIGAIKGRACEDERADMIALSKEFRSDIPPQISRLFSAPQVHSSVVEQSEIKNAIMEWIKK
ncbi:threonine synthase [Campylobacter gracilis]|uniref:Threonine synthase n=1 Tax=Campylobacter gracilis RM3268 TaxID=553220 RepID=C8PJ54_9BACT|nr:threonine synthase [Campylobacter gracilis]AKT92360.1 threonine synthase [Campylobacter gracilis]EEV16959.1 threonine synthase [Campylobacter gracilis RM3268]UEB45454.1 threonine synthase [Campylobacter gracilis]SUW81880.1 threonine synthase [Campylobacter gracilis]